MDRKKLLLYIQAALCALWAVLMAAAAVRICREGIAYQAQGHPEAWIYTREKAAAAIGRYLPVLLLAVVSNIVCVITGASGGTQDKPAADPALTSLYRKERGAASGAEGAEAAGRSLRIIRAAILITAIVFIIAGVINGSMEDMLIKAVNICTECIGLG